MKTILKLGLLLSVSAVSLTVSGCSGKSGDSDNGASSHYTKESYDFQTIYRNTGAVTFELYRENSPKTCRKYTYQINKSIGSLNYIRIELETNTDAVGWITYCDAADPESVNTEKFFVRAGDTEFTTFLDNYRQGAFGAFKTKIIQSVTFQGVDDTKCGELEFKSLAVGNKEYYTGRMYIDDGTIRLGTSTFFGGSIEWLERIDINVVEYIDAGGNVRIDKDIDPETIDSAHLISSSVNVVNTFDYGREVQPSYYLVVDKENNGYDPKTKYNYSSLSGTYSYNPIQCGGVGDSDTGIKTEAQIIDYEYDADHIYIKTKGQDWMFVNDQAEGYIEVNYRFGDDGVLWVSNSYTDFYQFSNLNSVRNPMSGQETPATYIVYPFNYYYCQTKTRTIQDPYLGSINGATTAIESPAATLTGEGNYYYAIRSSYLKNNCDWMAFVNDQRFGCGIFMPNADYYIGSRGNVSTLYSTRVNSYYSSLFYDFGSGLTPSYAASNYGYMNPQLRRRMVEFIPLEYEYAMYIGDTSEMAEAFDNAKSEGLTNENLTMNTGTWPKQ